MIRPQQFIVLAGAAIVSVALAAGLFASANRWSVGRTEGAPLVNDLKRKLNAVTTVEILQGDRKLSLERKAEAWSLKDRAGYPANTEKVRHLVLQLADAELIEPKTQSKERHALLELEDPKAKDAKSRGVRLLDQSGAVLADVVLGKSRFDAFGSGRGGIYVRRAGETRTWLASGDPKASLEIKDWVAATVFEMETDKIARVTLEHPGEDPLVVEKGETKDKDGKPTNAKYKLAQMPDDKKLKQGVSIDQIPQAFSSIDLEDVRKLDATPAGDQVSVVKVEADGGLTVTLRLRKDGDAVWMSFAATGEGDAKAKADALNAKGKGWEFKIPKWKGEAIAKRRADLFETS